MLSSNLQQTGWYFLKKWPSTTAPLQGPMQPKQSWQLRSPGCRLPTTAWEGLWTLQLVREDCGGLAVLQRDEKMRLLVSHFSECGMPRGPHFLRCCGPFPIFWADFWGARFESDEDGLGWYLP